MAPFTVSCTTGAADAGASAGQTAHNTNRNVFPRKFRLSPSPADQYSPIPAAWRNAATSPPGASSGLGTGLAVTCTRLQPARGGRSPPRCYFGAPMDENLQSSSRRREFLTAAAATLAAATLPAEEARAQQPADAEVSGTEHWTAKRADGRDIRLFLWRKQLRHPGAARPGTVVFVHGSSVSATPAFDLQVPGKPE